MYERGMFDLTAKQILVTGASSGIGQSVAEHCAAAGATVCITARNETRLDQTLRSLAGPSRHQSVTADQTKKDGLEHILAALSEPLHGAVLCAGVAALCPVRQVSDKHIETVLAINLHAPLMLTRLLLKRHLLHDGASLVFISSVAAHSGVKGNSVYSASKAGIAAASRCLAREVSSRRIRVNTVSPGLVHTPMIDMASAVTGGLALEASRYPLGIGVPAQIAGPVVFLLSEAASWITGADLVVDGGHTI